MVKWGLWREDYRGRTVLQPPKQGLEPHRAMFGVLVEGVEFL